MANYSNDHDLVKIRPGIMGYNIDDWSDKHTEAKREIDRAIEHRWYLAEAYQTGVDTETTPFDSDLLSSSQVKQLSCFKTLQLIYEFLSKDGMEEDGFSRQMKHFEDRYDKELQKLLTYGIEYDWDDSGTVDEDERHKSQYRRQKRA